MIFLLVVITITMMKMIYCTATQGKGGFNQVVDIYGNNNIDLMPFCKFKICLLQHFEISGIKWEPTIKNAECESGREGWRPGGLVC